MILHTENRAVVIIDECHWTPGVGAFLSVNASTSGAAVLNDDELAQIHAELGRIIAANAARKSTQRQREAAA